VIQPLMPMRVQDHLRRTGRRRILGAAYSYNQDGNSSAEWFSAEAVHERQWGQVRALLGSAYHSSPFYRRRLDHAGWPDVAWKQFRLLPLLTKQDIALHGSQISQPNGQGALNRTSGGSTGPVVTVPIDRETYGWYIAGTLRGIRWWGVDDMDPAVLLLGRSTSSPLQGILGRAKDWTMNWRRIPVDGQFDRRVPAALEFIKKSGPSFLYGYPSAVHRLAQEVRGRTWASRKRLAVIVLTGEPIYAFQRRSIEDAFQCSVAEEYGAGELGSMAFQCPRGEVHIVVETVVLETIPFQPPGIEAEGERIVATQLKNRLFPLIRYETGDVGFLSEGACPCGRKGPTIRVVGRVQDRLVGSRGPVPARPRIERFLSELPEPLQGHVQVAQLDPETIVLQVEEHLGSPVDPASIAAFGTDVFGTAWEVKAAEVKGLHRLPSGKLPYFLPMRAQE